jgi:excisionase family DNA binding protein
MTETFLTTHEVAALLRLTEPTIRAMAARREILYYRVAGRLRFSEEDVAEYIARARPPAFRA